MTSTANDVFSLQLVRWADSENLTALASAGQVDLSLPAGGPGMASDGRWDQLVLTRYPSVEALRTDDEPVVGQSTGIEDLLQITAQQGPSQ